MKSGHFTRSDHLFLTLRVSAGQGPHRGPGGWKNEGMAFLAALPEVLGLAGGAAAEGAAGGAAAGAGEAAAGGAGGGSGALGGIGKMFKSPVMPIPHMGSNGGQKPPALAQANSYLNADQFR